MSDTSFKLSGFISEFPLLEVIQFLGMTQKTGALRIAGSEKNQVIAVLFFKNGNLMHAEENDNTGLDVFFRVLDSATGYFKFSTGEEPECVTIDQPLHILLLESQRRQDELNHLDDMLPQDEAVMFIVPNLLKVPPLNTNEWRVLSMINGRRTLKRICEKIGDELEVKKMMLNLLNKGVVNTFSTDDTGWKQLTPKVMKSELLKSDRPYPPLLRTNLLLKTIDGCSTLSRLQEKLKINENELVEDIKLLHETQWITFAPNEEKTFSRLKSEM